MELIPNIIYNYLESNCRITVAGLGTFLTKGGRESVLFSEFMKGDDGTLRMLLVEGGADEQEAQSKVESFVVWVKAQIESEGRCDLSPIGELLMADGAITLQKCAEHMPQVVEPESSGEDKMIDSIVDSIVDSFMPSDQSDIAYDDAAPKFDVWLIGAMAAGAVALFALLYGVAVDWMTGNISFGGAIDGALESIFR